MYGGARVASGVAPAATTGEEPRTRALLLVASAVILVYAMAVAIPNVFTIDGLIYRAMAEAMARDGSFTFWTGYETYGSRTLDLLFMVPVGDQLVPQYPGGWAILAAPFHALGGIRGLFLLNALATVATIWLIRATTRELFQNPRAATAAALIFVFATFAFDYAGAVWPHAVTALCIAAATAAAARAWRRNLAAWALAAGLVLGFAVNFRVDAAFAAPAIGFWLLAATARPWANAGAFAAGMAPGLLVSAAINHAKFGLFTPITYGRTGPQAGGTSIDFYADLLPVAVVAAALTLPLGFARVRRIAYRPGVLAGVAAVLAVVALLPVVRPLAVRLLTGAGVLVIDIQTFRDAIQPGLVREMPDGTITLYGFQKKALLQSLPWLAACLILAPGLLSGRDRAGLALLLLLPVALVLPFAWSAWFGGRGNHMRYMINLLPALSILGGLVLDRLAAEPGRSRLLPYYAGGAAVFVGLGAGLAGGHDPLYLLQNTLPNVLAAALAVLSLGLLLHDGPGRPAIVSALRGVFAAALLMAFVSAWGLDLVVHQARRAKLYEITEAARTLPADAVIHAVRAEGFYERIARPPGLVALVWRDGSLYDPGFIRRVLAEGRPVFVQQQFVAEKMVADGIAGAAEPVLGLDPQDELYRITPP